MWMSTAFPDRSGPLLSLADSLQACSAVVLTGAVQIVQVRLPCRLIT